MGIYNYIFWHNTYEGIWYAIPRNEQQIFFGVDKNKAKGVQKSKNINTLIAIVADPSIVKIVETDK
jgi:hypothetical protein